MPEPPITGVPGAQIGGPLSRGSRFALRVGCTTARLDSEQFRSVQKNSGLPQGLACPLGSRLSVRQETLRCWVVTPGRKGKVRREAPRVHYAARQRGLVAARGERTADAEVADHRALEPDEGLG